jgi:HNH endonuclease
MLPMADDTVSRAEALAKGLKRYRTGKPCKQGHFAERFVINCACCECTADRTDEWIKSNPTAAKVRQDCAKRFRQENPHYQAQWVSKNKEKQRAYARNWYVKDPAKRVEVALSWKRENPEKARTHVRNWIARRKNARGSHSTEEILAILERQNWRCAEPTCGKSLRQRRHIDHVMPLAKGGSNDASNLQALCPTCNCRKSDKTPEEWARTHGRLL